MKPTDPDDEPSFAPGDDNPEHFWTESDDMYDPDLATAHDVGMPPFGVAL